MLTDIDRDKTNLFPAFAAILTVFEDNLAHQGLPFYLFEGFRSWERQEWLYAAGRTRPGKIVTNAKPGRSWHAYGMAADYVLDGMITKPGIQWSWEIRGHPEWLRMAQLAVGMGLEAAYFWEKFPECPHLQYPCGLTIERAVLLHLQGGLPAVWAEAQALTEKEGVSG